MEFFVNSDKLKESHSTEYHEFGQGKWDGKSFWRDNSLYLHDDLFQYGLVKAIRSVIPDYDYYGPNEISSFEWDLIGKAVRNEDKKSQKLYQEADSWLSAVFQKYDCFTLLGI